MRLAEWMEATDNQFIRFVNFIRNENEQITMPGIVMFDFPVSRIDQLPDYGEIPTGPRDRTQRVKVIGGDHKGRLGMDATPFPAEAGVSARSSRFSNPKRREAKVEKSRFQVPENL